MKLEIHHTRIGKFEIAYTNSKEFHSIKREVFSNQQYFIELHKSNPYIIDLGSHIGLSILYFKQVYPNATIEGYEPNPQTYEMLEDNVRANNLTEVVLHNLAVSSNPDEREFFIDSSDNNWFSTSSFYSKGWSGEDSTQSVRVKCVTLNQILQDKKVDLLKVDIEGAEVEILSASIKKLEENVENIIVEFHPVDERKPRKCIELLEHAGFQLSFYQEGKEIKPKSSKGLLLIKGSKSE